MMDRSHALKLGFLGWQCRLRQWAVREEGGRPSDGMRPAVLLPKAHASSGHLTVLINKQPSPALVVQLRHLVLQTHDPEERYTSALRYLGERYYQRAEEFDDELTALCRPDRPLVRALLAKRQCHLKFDAHNQIYQLPCRVRDIGQGDVLHQVTYWHNRLFNAHIPQGIVVLGFQPNWVGAQAKPLPLTV